MRVNAFHDQLWDSDFSLIALASSPTIQIVPIYLFVPKKYFIIIGNFNVHTLILVTCIYSSVCKLPASVNMQSDSHAKSQVPKVPLQSNMHQ